MKQITLLCVSIVLLFMVSCKKKTPIDPCANYDNKIPYAAISCQVNVDFLVEVDTILTFEGAGNPVLFKTTKPYNSYKWTIGNDDRTWTTPTVYLTFMGEGGGNTPITMIGKRTPDPCNPNDKGIDTLRTKLYVKRWNAFYPTEPYMFEGVWSGYLTKEPNRKFDITIKNWPEEDYYDGLRIHNIPLGCGTVNGVATNRKYATEIDRVSYSCFSVICAGTSNEGCYGAQGVGWVDRYDRNKITIDIGFGNVFVGTRKK